MFHLRAGPSKNTEFNLKPFSSLKMKLEGTRMDRQDFLYVR